MCNKASLLLIVEHKLSLSLVQIKNSSSVKPNTFACFSCASMLPFRITDRERSEVYLSCWGEWTSMILVFNALVPIRLCRVYVARS